MNVTSPDERPTSAPRLSRRQRAHRAHPRWALVAAGALALGLAPPAQAVYVLPPDNSGADQYVAPVPDAGGNHPSGPGTGHTGSLPPGVRSSLPPGNEGKLLARLATDPGSGAPVGVAGAKSSGGSAVGGRGTAGSGSNGSRAGGGHANGGATGAHEDHVNAASAITNAVSDNRGVGLLVGALFVLTVGVAALSLVQRRRRHT